MTESGISRFGVNNQAGILILEEGLATGNLQVLILSLSIGANDTLLTYYLMVDGSLSLNF